ncbi:MAG: electron transfer flavoprotein subunit alpha/FixB family protein [Synergistaceae bacterium]|jgi:electron transfer flavoprotein alpha subunit|nr:electron transfer flavoprotein subunit alpha/FixB family protein [Synergistaceae bacterium]
MDRGSRGICVFADNADGRIEPVVGELLTAAHRIGEITKEPVQALLIAEDCAGLVEELEDMAFHQIYAVETRGVSAFGDDSRSAVAAEMLRRVAPSCVLIPANDAGRSLFPRVAVKLNAGLTADCTELVVARRGNGEYFIKQNKPSFGDNVMVSIVHKAGRLPQMMTIREGVYETYQGNSPQGGEKPEVRVFQDILAPESAVSLLETLPFQGSDDMLSSDVVVVAGRGVEKTGKIGGKSALEAMGEFARKIGGALGGTRPLADSGLIPFENQIGQTGRVIRPEICLSFGVSGAIQHTDGIKDAKLFIAVNNDRNAPIFNVADYGVVADMEEILRALMERMERAG